MRRQAFYALPREHWELLAKPPFSYLETLDAVDDAIDKNAEIAQAILQTGLQSFVGPDQEDANSKAGEWRETATTNDLEKARSSIRQLFRDVSHPVLASFPEICDEESLTNVVGF